MSLTHLRLPHSFTLTDCSVKHLQQGSSKSYTNLRDLQKQDTWKKGVHTTVYVLRMVRLDMVQSIKYIVVNKASWLYVEQRSHVMRENNEFFKHSAMF